MKIQIKPYQVIENQNFDDAEVLISKVLFDQK